jgi:F-box-like
MKILDGEIEQLRESYDTIHSRYVDLQMELEATQSELHKANDLLTTVKNQRVALQSQQDDLRALMHPIRRCPDEILREIFELTIPNMAHHGETMRQSVRLSGVCQRWRNVALDTPRLWADIAFNLSSPSKSQRFLRICILPRLKQAPTTVILHKVTSNSLSALGESGLQDIPVIDLLALRVSRPADVQHILGPSFHPPVGTLQILSISAQKHPDSRFNITNCDVMRLVAIFPPCQALAIYRIPNLLFPVAATNTNITVIEFADSGQIDILRLLPCFPRLQSMNIRRAELVANDIASECYMASIKSIRLVDTTGEAWMERVFFPKLMTVFCDTSSEAFRAFLSRHPSIAELESILEGDAITGIATVATQLKELHLAPPLEAFCSLHDGSPQIPFPSLQRITITALAPPKNLTLAGFETVVRARCLPMRHPKSQAKHSSSIVRSFAIITHDSAAEGPHLGWQESDLYQESTKEIDEKDPSKVYLSWPEWE